MNQDKTFLGTEPIGPLLRKLAIPTVAAVCLYRSGRDTKEQLRLLQERDTAQARYSTDEMSAEVDDPLSYQQLYPDFYVEGPAPALENRENTMYLTFDRRRGRRVPDLRRRSRLLHAAAAGRAGQLRREGHLLCGGQNR